MLGALRQRRARGLDETQSKLAGIRITSTGWMWASVFSALGLRLTANHRVTFTASPPAHLPNAVLARALIYMSLHFSPTYTHNLHTIILWSSKTSEALALYCWNGMERRLLIFRKTWVNSSGRG